MDITTPISTFQNIPENGKTAALVTLNKELQQQMSSDFKLLRSGSLKDGSAIDLTALNSSYVQNASTIKIETILAKKMGFSQRGYDSFTFPIGLV